MSGEFRRLLIKLLKPISVLVGKIYFAPKKRDIKAKDVSAMLDVLEIGDVLVTFSKGELTNYLIEGTFKHVGMYIGDEQVIEAIGKGVTVNSFDDFCSSKDRIAIVRPLFCTADERNKAAAYSMLHIGRPYDYYFEPSEKAFYCAELVYEAYMAATDFKSPFIKREVLGVETILPNDFYVARKKFELIMEKPQ